jgi:hypothetical protein
VQTTAIFEMSLHVTPSPPGGRTPQSATTKLSTQLQAHHILYDIDLLVQDMTSIATKMTDTLFENRDDKRARLKLKPSYLDHLKALEQVNSSCNSHSNYLEYLMLPLCTKVPRRVTPMQTSKEAASSSPVAKGTALMRSVFQLHWLITTPNQRRSQRRTHQLPSVLI